MRARVLGRSDEASVAALLATDPVTHCFVASRVSAGVLDPGSAGDLWGYPADAPRALLHVGTNCVPVATDSHARAAFARELGPYRPFVGIVGPASEALALQAEFAARYGGTYARPRVIRQRQLLMATERVCPGPADARVQPVTAAHLESYFAAAVALYTEELGESPLVTNPVGYRRYVSGLIEQGRAFGIVEGGEAIFKADIGAVGGSVAQVQGVWIDPRLRGRGLAAPAMAAVTNLLVARGQTASLYVNDFNTPAIATYRRCGYEVVGEFASVLY